MHPRMQRILTVIWFHMCDIWSAAERFVNNCAEAYGCGLCSSAEPMDSPEVLFAEIVSDYYRRDITREMKWYYENDRFLTTSSLDRFLTRRGLVMFHNKCQLNEDQKPDAIVKILVEGHNVDRGGYQRSHVVFVIDPWNDKELLSGRPVDSMRLSDLLDMVS